MSFLIRARRVIELLQLSGTDLRSLLDIGCGTAPIAESIVAMGSRYTGIDFSSEMVSAAAHNISALLPNGQASVSLGDVTKMNVPDSSFDAVTAMGVIEYLSRDEVRRSLTEIRRVLRPGGVSIITIPKRWNWGRLVIAVLYPLRKLIRKRPRVNLKLVQEEEFRRLYLTPRELDEACKQVGLQKVSCRHYNFQFLCRPATLVAPRLCYLVNRPFEQLARIPGLGFFATGYIGMYRHD